jgi:hypothetical protein
MSTTACSDRSDPLVPSSLPSALCAGAQTAILYCLTLSESFFRQTTLDTRDQATDLFLVPFVLAQRRPKN